VRWCESGNKIAMASGEKDVYMHGPDREERGDKQLDRYPLTPDKVLYP